MVGAGRSPDADHHDGHAKAEAISQNAVAVLLLLAGLELAHSAISGFQHRAQIPGTHSHAILVGAIDNQMDAISSLTATLGILAFRMGCLAGDNLAALMVVVLVMWAGIEVFRTEADDLMDPAGDEGTHQAIREVARAVVGVWAIVSLRTRRQDGGVLVDLEIEGERSLSVIPAHAIVCAVQDVVTGLDRVIGATVRVNPSQEGGPI